MKSFITPSVYAQRIPFPPLLLVNGGFNTPNKTPLINHSVTTNRSRRPSPSSSSSSSSSSSRTFYSFSPLAMASASTQMAAPGDIGGGFDDGLQLIRAHQEHEGYPSGSMVDFACDHDSSPILAVSSLAVHSKNISANPKCSLLVAKDPQDRTDTLITVYGDAINVSDSDRDAVCTAYLRRHPDAFWINSC